jgi:hypothetical protein
MAFRVGSGVSAPQFVYKVELQYFRSVSLWHYASASCAALSSCAGRRARLAPSRTARDSRAWGVGAGVPVTEKLSTKSTDEPGVASMTVRSGVVSSGSPMNVPVSGVHEVPLTIKGVPSVSTNI